MSLARLLGKVRPAAIASLYVGSLLFVLPSIFDHLDRPGARFAKSSETQGTSHFAIADLDGDLRPDTATIRVAHDCSRVAEYFLELQLSSGSRPAIGILGPKGGLEITPQDVNGDKIADLVITSPFDTHFVAILLNDGKGNFKQVATSDYPEVGRHPGSRLFFQDDSAALQPTLGEKPGTEGQGAGISRGERLLENDSRLGRPTTIALRSFPVSARAGRAPPLV